MINNDYETEFLNKLNLRDRRLIELYKQYNFGEDFQAKTRQEAGFKAAKTRQRNEGNRAKRGRRSKQTLANYERNELHTFPKYTRLSDSKIDEILLQTVRDNPGKYSIGVLDKLIPAKAGRISARIHALREAGKIRHEGGIQRTAGCQPKYRGKWFPA
jgi:hypothetical protein